MSDDDDEAGWEAAVERVRVEASLEPFDVFALHKMRRNLSPQREAELTPKGAMRSVLRGTGRTTRIACEAAVYLLAGAKIQVNGGDNVLLDKIREVVMLASPGVLQRKVGILTARVGAGDTCWLQDLAKREDEPRAVFMDHLRER